MACGARYAAGAGGAALARVVASEQPAVRFLAAAQRGLSGRAGRAGRPSRAPENSSSSKEVAPSVGEAKHGWAPVRDPATGGTYYWNKATNETTAVGEPRPGLGGRTAPASSGGSMLGSIGTLMCLGAGVAIAGTAVRMLLG
eukprot:jgi/Tetstr1/431239/TSEL_002058.t1